ncbi:hypothetical protein FS837_012473 [Tulasnella sp. UAMH 9824]|nr:hypothetical protein FS837_012473 [Tulasnella sp. UAMH 9824]
MTAPVVPPFVVRAPFDADSAGDFILRVSDGTEFKVLRAILSVASCVFRDMFDTSSELSNEKQEITNLPVVKIEEDAETTQTLLQMLYPIDPPSINSVHLAHKLITAFDKYFISLAKLQFHLRNLLKEDQYIKQDPIFCYSLAWKLGWKEEAVGASRHTHTLDLIDSAVAGPIVSLSGDLEAFLSLLRLRNLREKALDEILSLVQPRKFGICSADRPHPPAVVVLEDYHKRRAHLVQALKVPNPNCEDIETFLGFTGGTSSGYALSCPSCQEGWRARLVVIRASTVAALQRYPQAITQ